MPKQNDKTKQKLAARKATTASYEPIRTVWWKQTRDLPLFTFFTIRDMLRDPTVRLGLAMRAAPLFGAEFAYKDGENWVPGIKACDEVVGAFVLQQLEKIWGDLQHLVSAQVWGWAAAEVMYKLNAEGTVEYCEMLPRAAGDVRCFVTDGQISGVQFRRVQGENNVDIDFPKSIFTSYRPEPGEFYGLSVLQGAYSPWADKWLNGGALDVRRLYMTKDSYRGASLRYPDRSYPDPTQPSGFIHARDIARQIVEQVKSGGVVTLPSEYDAGGNPLWVFEEAKTNGGADHILQYPKDLDVEMLRGMEIPDDVLTAEATGSWAGKTVPMQAFYSGLDVWLAQIIRDVKRCIMDYLVFLKFGPEAWYEVSTKPLALQAMEQQGEKKGAGDSQQGPSMFAPPQYGGGSGEGGQQPRPAMMGLDPVEAVGTGALRACDIVKAARTMLAGVSDA